jgi:hypothetical protein
LQLSQSFKKCHDKIQNFRPTQHARHQSESLGCAPSNAHLAEHNKMSTSKHVVSFAMAFAVCGVSVYLFQTTRRHEEAPKSGQVFVSLLPIETTLAKGGGGDNPMSTISWFLGDIQHALQLLKERAEQVLHANPWLGGRVVKRNGTFVLSYNPRNINLEDLFSSDETTTLDSNNGKSVSSRFLVTNGPTQPLWKLTVVSSTETNKFAVVMSMSHIIADGATFYNLQNMLFYASPVEALIVQRIQTTQSQQIQAMGGMAEYAILQSAGFILNCILGVAKGKLVGPVPMSRIYFVNDEEIQKMKLQQAAIDDDVDYVSTNDILTSWFLQNCSCQHGLMAINFRNRLAGHSNQHAGNYENVLFYNRQDSKTPSLIRKSLSTFRRCVSESMPSFFQMAAGTTAIASNWSSFAKPAALPGCLEEMHLPIYDVKGFLPSTMAVMCIFRAGPKGLGVLVLAGTPDKLAGLQNSPFLVQNE